jgi:thiamine biosynthesis lipoprotein
MAAADAALSRFLPESDLCRLNAEVGSGRRHAVIPRLRRMLALAHRAQRMTAGRFDPRTLEVLEALGERAQVEYAPATSPVIPGDGTWLCRDARDRVAISAPIDSGGIGKGLGLRWALSAARGAVPRAAGLLLEAGGDVATAGGLPSGGPWQIGIEDPDDAAESLAVVTLRDGALATSSVAVRAWTDAGGRAVHHLVDPKTWLPADTGLRAVTVAHEDPAWAEVWSKALFVGGARTIGPEARKRGMAVWWVEKDSSLHLTPAAARVTIWQRGT